MAAWGRKHGRLRYSLSTLFLVATLVAGISWVARMYRPEQPLPAVLVALLPYDEVVGRTEPVEVPIRIKEGGEIVGGVFLWTDDNGSIDVRSARCTHCGSRIRFDSSKNHFFCLTYNTIYSAEGESAGLPPRSMDRLRHEFKQVNGIEYVFCWYQEFRPGHHVVVPETKHLDWYERNKFASAAASEAPAE